MEVRQLFISPGHNFVGHHGEPPGDHPIVAVEQIECVAGRGIRGDRFFDHQPDFKGQITFFAMEVVESLAYELGLAGVRPELTRRNVFTRGADLSTLIGVEFEVQGVRFAGTEECRPCYWMDQAFGDERIEAWLQGRGGLRARILTDGFLTAKDGGLERHGRLHRARSGDPDRRTERLAGRVLRSAAAAASQGRARFDLTSQEGTMTSSTIPDGSTQESKRPVTPVRSTLREPEEGERPPGKVWQPDQAPPAPDDGPDAAAAAEASHWFG